MTLDDRAFIQPLIAVDVVPIVINDKGSVSIILSKRLFEPFKNEYALPGVLFNSSETLEEAAFRALQTKAGLSSSYIKNIGFFDSPFRDPRKKAISLSFIAFIKEDDFNRSSFDLKPLTINESNLEKEKLPFDHNLIIKEALKLFQKSFLNTFENIFHKEMFAIMDKSVMSSSMLTQIAEDLNLDISSSNIARRVRKLPYIEESDEVIVHGRGKPSASWRVFI